MQMKKTIIWGTGGTSGSFLEKRSFYRECDIVAFADNDEKKWGSQYWGVDVISPYEIANYKIDILLICSIHIEDIKRQLTEIQIDKNIKIISYLDIEEEIKQSVIEKYEHSYDAEIVNCVNYLRDNQLDVFCGQCPDVDEHEVYRDEDGHPYIMYYGRRMYYPDDWLFSNKNGKEYLYNVEREQQQNSPHKYVNDVMVEIPMNSVIVDAGVCEGNFALKYIDRVKKCYLFESDERWREPLLRTFEPYKEKIVFCDKYLCDKDSATTIMLDSIIEEPIDFLKMDIEGAEIYALAGGKRILESSDAHCSICCYHNIDDKAKIEKIFEQYGYATSLSSGYMLFVYDNNFIDTLDFRKGIVYANKRI